MSYIYCCNYNLNRLLYFLITEYVFVGIAVVLIQLLLFFQVFLNSRIKLMEASFTPGDPFPTVEAVRDGKIIYSHMWYFADGNADTFSCFGP